MMQSSNVLNSVSLLEPNSPDFLDYALSHDFGELHFKVDPKTGMKAIIAIHNLNRGPALGGCRFIPYSDTRSAIFDAMRLARGMSFKAALADLPLGGGKSVIIQPLGDYDREGYLHSFGSFVESLNGRYIAALDSGTQLSDMDIIAEHTPYVASLSSYDGDPSPYTAQGMLKGIEASVLFKWGSKDLKGARVVLQGLGHVGFLLAQYLYEAGAELTVTDINPVNIARLQTQAKVKVVSPEDIYSQACDIFSPCALGAILNEQSIHQLKASIVAGSANNQLAHSYHGQLLLDKGILYAPDYVINAGGLIFAASKFLQFSETLMQEKMVGIGRTLIEIYERSEKENRPTNEISDVLAQEKINKPF